MSRPLRAPFKPPSSPLQAPFKPPSRPLQHPFKPVLSEAFMKVRPLEAPLKPLEAPLEAPPSSPPSSLLKVKGIVKFSLWILPGSRPELGPLSNH